MVFSVEDNRNDRATPNLLISFKLTNRDKARYANVSAKTGKFLTRWTIMS